ncbi:LCP family protein [Ornithinibacillus californiensis]|uniref:LCP family protein n=1 Tax=Ornithinibacillus californiensis TaxID=161536 RepID=UPI00064DBC4B|nr:LCP family protein [Ornithinibacillus californiensis]
MSEQTVVKKPRMRKRTIILLSLLAIALLIFGGLVSYGFYLYNKAEDTAEQSYEAVERKHPEEKDTSQYREDEVDPVRDSVSMLIIGIDDSDQRQYGTSRSDTLILATFNKSEGKVKLLSIPRDTYVYVSEIDEYTKINHAHAYGGPSATIETVEDYLQVPVDYYVRVNFKAFIEVVDSLGGINFEVPYEMYELDSKENKNAIHLMPGEQELNGEEALAIARTRKYDNDIERGKRQIEVIKAIVKQATSVSSFLKLDDLIEAIGNNMTTNIRFDQMKTFSSYALDENLKIESTNLEGSGGYMDDGLWYFQVDEESKQDVTNELREHLELPPIETDNFYGTN